jgi:hypothetical protein
MGIPNLAHRRRHGQEWQSRCKLAMPKLAIYVGHHRAVSMRQPSGRSRRIAVAAHPGFPLAAGDRIPRKVKGSRRQVAYWFFCVVQLRTALVVTPVRPWFSGINGDRSRLRSIPRSWPVATATAPAWMILASCAAAAASVSGASWSLKVSRSGHAGTTAIVGRPSSCAAETGRRTHRPISRRHQGRASSVLSAAISCRSRAASLPCSRCAVSSRPARSRA